MSIIDTVLNWWPRPQHPAEKAADPADRMDAIGVTGLKRYGPFSQLYEEFLTELKGQRGVRIYREMRDNDATIGAVMHAIEITLRRVKWDVQGEDVDKVEFVESCIKDMSPTFSEFISEVLSFATYGWSLHAVGYKRRNGYKPNSKLSSRYSDGLIGWSGWPIRGQDTLLDWHFDINDPSMLLGMRQLGPPTFQMVEIPMDRAMLFRARMRKESPEGVSLLRSAYRAWYAKRHIENIEGIGVERDLAGMPVCRMSGNIAGQKPAHLGGSTVYDAMKAMLTQIRRDEQEGIIIPGDRDENGNPFVELELMSSKGNRQLDVSKILERYARYIAMVMLSDFILLGHEAVGSFALADSKTSLFAMSLGALMQNIADVINETEIPRLFRLNGWPVDDLPRLVPGDIEDRDLKQLGDFLTALSQTGFALWPNRGLEDYVLDVANLPKPTEEERTTMAETPPPPKPQVPTEPTSKFNPNHVQSGPHGGEFTTGGGGGGNGGGGLKSTKERAFNGETVETKTKLSKLETGAIGEKVVISYLKSQGFKDARSTNVKVNNFAVDLVHDHEAFEVKAGLVSNGKSAQQWRATIGQPGKAESAWLKKASPEAKRAWNEKKGQDILSRKTAALNTLSKQLGRKVKGSTFTVILNPDKKTADLYKFSGFHLRIAWNSAQAKAGYIGSYKYE